MTWTECTLDPLDPPPVRDTSPYMRGFRSNISHLFKPPLKTSASINADVYVPSLLHKGRCPAGTEGFLSFCFPSPASPLFRHCEHLPPVIASEAKQSNLIHMQKVDCFVASLLAMTAGTDNRLLRHFAPRNDDKNTCYDNKKKRRRNPIRRSVPSHRKKIIKAKKTLDLPPPPIVLT